MSDAITILSGHLSPETAYTVADYPYGFRLRCTIRYWLEAHPKKGARLVSQTSNPKKPGLVWNAPKASTYARMGGCMFIDSAGHVTWSGLTEYSNAAGAAAWQETYGAGNPPILHPVTAYWVAAKRAYEARRDAGASMARAAADAVVAALPASPAGADALGVVRRD